MITHLWTVCREGTSPAQDVKRSLGQEVVIDIVKEQEEGGQRIGGNERQQMQSKCMKKK